MLTLAATLVTVAVIARNLGVSGYGDYRVIIAFLSFAVLLGNLGTPLIVQRELAKENADQARILGNALGLRIVSIAFAIAIAGLIAILSIRPIIAIGVAVGSIGFIAMGAHNVLFALFQQRLRQAGVVVAETAGAFALLIMAWLLGKADFGVIAFVAATAGGSLLTIAIAMIFALRLLRFSPRFEIAEWKTILAPAIPIAVTESLCLVYYRFDTILLGVMKPADIVGLYGVPSKILDAIIGFTLLFSGLLMPLMSRYISTDMQRFRLYLDTGIDTLMIATSGILVVVLLYAEEILTAIAGVPFAAGGQALRILGVVAILASIRYMAQQAATVLDAQRELVPGYVAAAIVGVIAYVLLIRQFGGTGAASGLLVGESIVMAWALRVLHRHGVRLTISVPLKVAISVGVTALLMNWVKSTGELPWYFGVLLAPLAYFVFLLLFRGAPRHVLELLKLTKTRDDKAELMQEPPEI